MLPALPETVWVCSDGQISDYIQPYWDGIECTLGLPILCPTVAFNYTQSLMKPRGYRTERRVLPSVPCPSYYTTGMEISLGMRSFGVS